MEVKGQVISVPEPLRQDRKQRAGRLMELQERRRSLQALLSVRLAELRRVCLQEAELTGAVPSDFPLEAGERPPQVRRRVGTVQSLRPEEEGRCKVKKKNQKRKVHRGCHTDATGSENILTSDSRRHNGAGRKLSPMEVFYQNPRRSSQSSSSNSPRTSLPRSLSNVEGTPLSLTAPLSPTTPTSVTTPLLPTTPLHPRSGPITAHIRSQNSSSSPPLPPGSISYSPSPPSRGEWGDHTKAPEVGSVDEPAGGLGRPGRGRGPVDGEASGRRGGAYNDLLLEYVWGKQHKSQSHGNPRQPISSHHTAAYSYPVHPPPQPALQGQPGEPGRAKVSRTKSCGPFLLPQHSQMDQPNTAPLRAIQPDPHPHLQPPRPQLPPTVQETHLEEATRSLHKALALEGLRDWYLRNTLGSAQQQKSTNGTVPASINSKVKGGVASPEAREATGRGLQRRRTTHIVLQPSDNQNETHRQLQHSATFHGHPLHGRSQDPSFLPKRQEVPLKELTTEQPSPGTLV